MTVPLEQPAQDGANHGPSLRRAPRQDERLGVAERIEKLATDAPRDVVGIVEEIERGQRLRRDRVVRRKWPGLVDHPQQHRIDELVVVGSTPYETGTRSIHWTRY